MATAVRCFALFPPPGGTWAEPPPAPGLGDDGETGPGLGDAEPGVASGWEQEGVAGSGTERSEKARLRHRSTLSATFTTRPVTINCAGRSIVPVVIAVNNFVGLRPFSNHIPTNGTIMQVFSLKDQQTFSFSENG